LAPSNVGKSGAQQRHLPGTASLSRRQAVLPSIPACHNPTRQRSENDAMHIWVDADACPAVIKEILYRAAQRVGVPLTLVANQPLRTPPSPLIRTVQVRQGFDVADDHISERVQPGDLVITGDIPLAAQVVEKGGDAINPRGERYTPDNIRERLAMRNFMEELRGAGEVTGGPPPLNQADRQAFANALDRLLAQRRS
jgi:uncharacterized protein YaiI (UPF0178 family)